jgi:predicted DNA-binding ribbon-helix-helix protein
MQSSVIKKRSIRLAGRKTAVSLENEFWESLREIATGSGEPVSQLISDINKGRQSANLSSAIRMFVLRHYRDQLERRGGTMVASPTLAPLIEHVAPFRV